MNVTLTTTMSDGGVQTLTLAGKRGAVAHWAARRLPTDRPWGTLVLVTLARALGARAVPQPPYANAEEAEAYRQGFDAGFHDEPMAPNEYPNAYSRGYWEGKR